MRSRLGGPYRGAYGPSAGRLRSTACRAERRFGLTRGLLAWPSPDWCNLCNAIMPNAGLELIFGCPAAINAAFGRSGGPGACTAAAAAPTAASLEPPLILDAQLLDDVMASVLQLFSTRQVNSEGQLMPADLRFHLQPPLHLYKGHTSYTPYPIPYVTPTYALLCSASHGAPGEDAGQAVVMLHRYAVVGSLQRALKRLVEELHERRAELAGAEHVQVGAPGRGGGRSRPPQGHHHYLSTYRSVSV